MKDGNYKYCVDCWRPEGDGPGTAEFWSEESRQYQDTTRCKKCLALYVAKFKKKYPNTKTKHRYIKVTKELEQFSSFMMRFK